MISRRLTADEDVKEKKRELEEPPAKATPKIVEQSLSDFSDREDELDLSNLKEDIMVRSFLSQEQEEEEREQEEQEEEEPLLHLRYSVILKFILSLISEKDNRRLDRSITEMAKEYLGEDHDDLYQENFDIESEGNQEEDNSEDKLQLSHTSIVTSYGNSIYCVELKRWRIGFSFEEYQNEICPGYQTFVKEIRWKVYTRRNYSHNEHNEEVQCLVIFEFW